MKNQWLYQIDKYYDEAINVLINHNSSYRLEKANIDIFVSSGRRNGYWNSSKRVIGLNENLFKYYEENGVKFVLWHEIAHQVVSEIFKYEGVNSHGEHFKRACLILGINDKSCHDSEFLSNYKCGKSNPIMNKLEKLLDVSGRSEAEAQSFLNKANELMLKHNLTLNDIYGNNRLFLKRQVGGNYNRFPTYLFSLGSIMNDFYGVKYIKTYAYVSEIGNKLNRKITYHMELYGEPDKLDLAEYVYENILRKSDELYEFHKNDESREISSYRKLSKKAFYNGLFKGFRSKLEQSQKTVVEKLEEERGELIKLDDPLLKEYYESAYRVQQRNIASSRASGFNAGYSAGKGLVIQSVIKSESKGQLISGR